MRNKMKIVIVKGQSEVNVLFTLTLPIQGVLNSNLYPPRVDEAPFGTYIPSEALPGAVSL